jgi:uncharacterized protein
MLLEILTGEFSVCQLQDWPLLDPAADFCFLAKTDEEISLVCRSGCEPAGCKAIQAGWRAFRVAGQLDFALVGILAGLSKVLADAGISLFAISTFNTDYLLVRKADLAAAINALRATGYNIIAAES